MKVKFQLKNPKEGNNTVYVRVRIGRAIDLFLATKEKVNLHDWDEKNQCLLEEYIDFKNGKQSIKRDAETKEKISLNKKVNYRLIELKKEIEDCYKSTNGKINQEWLRNILYPEVEENKEQTTTFTDYCDTFLELKGNTISKAYATKVKSIKEMLFRYMQYRRIKKILLTDINISFKIDFEKYCIEIEKYSINYFEKCFKFIKTILNYAKQNGLEIYSSISTIRFKTEKTMFVILTPKELELIEQSTFSDEHLETAKDWLLISCFSGQRISDFMRFNTSMICEKILNGKKRYFIEFVQEKTKKQILLPLSKKIIEILNKRNWSFPRTMSEPRYNEHIKTVCEYVGIDELVEGTLSVVEKNETINKRKNNRRKIHGFFPKYKLVSSHIGRRTFASNNFGKIPTPLLMVATGHSSPNMLMKYIGKIDEQQSMALAEYL